MMKNKFSLLNFHVITFTKTCQVFINKKFRRFEYIKLFSKDKPARFTFFYKLDKLKIFSILILCILLSSCGRYEEFKNSATENYSDAKMQKYAKYMIQGKQLYTTHCSNCHQEQGDGLGKLFPPLAKSDYMLADIPRSICAIKNGLKGEIEVNGKTYNQAMPALDRLTNLEIAEISTYIYNRWGNEKGIIEIETVKESLSNCQ